MDEQKESVDASAAACLDRERSTARSDPALRARSDIWTWSDDSRRDPAETADPMGDRRRSRENPPPHPPQPAAPPESSPNPSDFSAGGGEDRMRRPSAPSCRSVTKSPPGPRRTKADVEVSMSGMGDSACPAAGWDCQPDRIPSVVVAAIFAANSSFRFEGGVRPEQAARKGGENRGDKR